jgi:hypothetical protein
MRTRCYSHAINTLTYDLDQGSYVQNSTLEGKERELSCAFSTFREGIACDPWHVFVSHDSEYFPQRAQGSILPQLSFTTQLRLMKLDNVEQSLAILAMGSG